LRMGRKGLFVAPLQPERVLEITQAVSRARDWALPAAVARASPPSYETRGVDAAVNRLLGPVVFPCPLCGDVRGESVEHLVAQCSHPGLAPIHTAVAASVPKLLRDIVSAASSGPMFAVPPAAVDTAVAAVTATAWASPDGVRLLTHLVLAAPLPPKNDEAETPGCDAVRSLCDVISVRDRRTARRVADVWVRWAVDWAWRLVRARLGAYEALAPVSGAER
jgi:hypothetical protein